MVPLRRALPSVPPGAPFFFGMDGVNSASGAGPNLCLCARPKDALQPRGEVAVERIAALVEPVPTAGIKNEFLRLAGTRIKIVRAAVGEDFVRFAMHEERGAGRNSGHSCCAGGLAAERGNCHYKLAQHCRIDDNCAPERMPNEDDAALPLMLEPGKPHQDIGDALREISGATIGKLERRDAARAELAAKAGIEPARGSSEATSGAKHPQDSAVAR